VLFALQLVHLYWLTTDVVIFRLAGTSFFPETSGLITFLIVIIDYLEIPAIISVSLVYIHSLRKKKNTKDIWYLILLNSQWLHIFWITDEIVIESFINQSWHPILIWIAILIDYLEFPIIFETIKRAFKKPRP